MIAQRSGAMANTVVMDADAWMAFRNTPAVLEILDRPRANSTLTTNAVLREGASYMGNIDGFDIWVYAGWYIDPEDGLEKPYLPSGSVILSGPGLEGTRAYGAIRDERAAFQALPYFAKSWSDEDPSLRYLLMQSAPLLVPYRVNASLAAKVL